MKLFFTVFLAVVLGVGTVAAGVIMWQNLKAEKAAALAADEAARQINRAAMQASKERELRQRFEEMQAQWRSDASEITPRLESFLAVWRDNQEGSWSDEAALLYAKTLTLGELTLALAGADKASEEYHALRRRVIESRDVFAKIPRLLSAEKTAKAEYAELSAKVAGQTKNPNRDN